MSKASLELVKLGTRPHARIRLECSVRPDYVRDAIKRLTIDGHRLDYDHGKIIEAYSACTMAEGAYVLYFIFKHIESVEAWNRQKIAIQDLRLSIADAETKLKADKQKLAGMEEIIKNMKYP